MFFFTSITYFLNVKRNSCRIFFLLLFYFRFCHHLRLVIHRRFKYWLWHCHDRREGRWNWAHLLSSIEELLMLRCVNSEGRISWVIACRHARRNFHQTRLGRPTDCVMTHNWATHESRRRWNDTQHRTIISWISMYT